METCCILMVNGAAGFITKPTKRSLASLAARPAVGGAEPNNVRKAVPFNVRLYTGEPSRC